MKPFTKICLIVCGVLVLFGFTGIGISLAMGLEPDQLLDLAHYPGKFEEHGIPKLPEAAEPAELPEIEAPAEIFGHPASDLDECYAFEDVSGIDMDLAICDLTLKSHQKDTVILQVQNSQNSFHFSQDNDRLTLKDDRSTKGLDFQKEALFLTVYLPAQTLEQLDIKVGVGDIHAEDLNIQDLYMESGVGDLDLETLTCETANLISGVGNLTVDRLITSSEASLESGTGDITIDYYDGPDLDLDCGIGDAFVTACGQETDYSYDLNCDLGDLIFRHSQETHHDKQHNGLGHHLSSEHGADKSLSLHCGAGDITLNFTEED